MVMRIGMAFFLSLYLLFSLALGQDVICEALSPAICAFAISTTGKRCVAEIYRPEGSTNTAYACQTSEVAVERLVDWVETDECVEACGADRQMVGISSDALFDMSFTEKLCSPECFYNCPNLIDLYSNLAAGEGVVLSHLCETRRTNPVRAMAELSSSGNAALAAAPTIYAESEFSMSAAPITGAPSPTIVVPIPSPTTFYSDSIPASSITPDNAAPVPSFSEDDVAPSDVLNISTDASTDQLDADPAPVSAMPPSDFFDSEPEEEDADYI